MMSWRWRPGPGRICHTRGERWFENKGAAIAMADATIATLVSRDSGERYAILDKPPGTKMLRAVYAERL